MTPDEAAALRIISNRVRANEPRHRDPEAFHVEKSEIVRDIGRLLAGHIPANLRPQPPATAVKRLKSGPETHRNGKA